MAEITRRFAIGFGSFVVAWIAAFLVARWLFGSGNILIWVIAAVAGVTAYLATPRREHTAG